MKKPSVLWGATAALLVSVVSILGVTNPALSEYREQILVTAAHHRQRSSDALLAAILQSLPMGSSPESSQDSSGLLTVLMNRTKRDNYAILSVYSTEFDYCQANSVSRSVGKTLGIAGKFYVLQTGDCPT